MRFWPLGELGINGEQQRLRQAQKQEHLFRLCSWPTMPSMRLIKHTESYEVRYPDGTPSRYFYFDDNPGRRAINKRMSPAEAEEQAKVFARGERDRFSRPGSD